MSNRHLNNPWFDQHVEAEAAYGEGGAVRRWRAARARVAAEFDLGPDPIPCPGERCTATTFWRATVGAYVCPDCGTLAHGNGVLIKDKS